MNANSLVPAVAIVCFATTACAPSTDHRYVEEGRPYAETLLRSVSRDWTADKLVEVADPRLFAVASEAKIREMLAYCATHLGAARRQETMAESISVETGISGKIAVYIFNLEAEKGTARVTIKMQKTEGRWMVLGFWANLPTPPK